MLHTRSVLAVSVALVFTGSTGIAADQPRQRVRALNRELVEGSTVRDQSLVVTERESALQELIQSDPAGALQLQLPEDLQHGLAARYPQMATHLETRGKWQGPLVCLTHDDFKNHRSNSFCEMRVAGE